MNDNSYIGTSGLTMYVGDNAVLSAYTGWYQIFPATEREWNFEIRYNITGGTHDIINPDVLGSIDWMEIDGVRMSPASAYTFAPGTSGIVRYKANGTYMAWQNNTLVTGATCYENPGAYTFEGCTNLTDVNLARVDWLGSSGTFKNCSSLENITIPDGILSIGSECFLCAGLKSVIIPNSVYYIGDACFVGCPLTSVTFGTSIRIIEHHAFQSCSGITGTLVLPSIVEIHRYAFYECSGISGVSFGNSLTTIGEFAFAECTGLTGTLTLPDSLTGISQFAFYDNSRVTGTGISTIVIGTGVTDLYYSVDAFGECKNLTTLYFNSVQPLTYQNGMFGFNGSQKANVVVYYHQGADISKLQDDIWIQSWTYIEY